MKNPEPDVVVENHGSIFLFRPLNSKLLEWTDMHIDRDEAQFFGENVLVVEHRYAETICRALINDGFVLSFPNENIKAVINLLKQSRQRN